MLVRTSILRRPAAPCRCWVGEGHSRFHRGTIKDLSYFKEKSRRAKLEFEMVLVQPGGSVASITDDDLATAELYLLKTTQAKFRVVRPDGELTRPLTKP